MCHVVFPRNMAMSPWECSNGRRFASSFLMVLGAVKSAKVLRIGVFQCGDPVPDPWDCS